MEACSRTDGSVTEWLPNIPRADNPCLLAEDARLNVMKGKNARLSLFAMIVSISLARGRRGDGYSYFA